MFQVIGGILAGFASRRIIAGIITGIGYLLRTQIGLIFVSGLLWLGVNFATIKIFVQPSLDLLYSYMQGGGAGGQFGATAMQWLGVMQLDKAATMVGSAVLLKHTVMQGRLFLFKKGFGAPP